MTEEREGKEGKGGRYGKTGRGKGEGGNWGKIQKSTPFTMAILHIYIMKYMTI